MLGKTIKTHGSGFVGKVVQQHGIYVGKQYRKQFGIEANEPYVAYATQLDDSEHPREWTTLIGRNDSEIETRYVVA